ncbi:MAG TPA: TIR domain-containing protein [Rhizomicrobium sp.]|jgi:tetratricopeptide (TPR) repeat protein
MADIFISYAREDRSWVRGLAQALEAEGLSVWWDPNLLPGSRYRETIEKELDQAYASIVVWSEDSIKSDFVRDEAEEARVLNRLVPVLKDTVQPPHGFRQIQTADLSGWRGKRDHSEYVLVLEGLRALAGAKPGGAALPKPKPKPANSAQGWLEKLKSPAGMAAAAAGVLLLIVVAFFLGRGGHTDDAQVPPAQQQTAIAPMPAQTPLANSAQMTLAQKVDACAAGGQPPDAMIALCNEALQAPNLAPASILRMRNNRGIAYNITHQFQNALNDFNAALEIDPRYAPALGNRGFAYYSMQQFNAAATDYNQSILIDPTDSGTHGMRGDLESRNWQLGPAITDYEKVTELQPNNFFGWKSLCLTRGMANTDLAQAESDCNRALALNHSNYSAFDAMGLVRLRQANNQGAIFAFNRALSLQPNVATSLYGRGLALQRMGNPTDANRDFTAARTQRSDIDTLFSRMGMTR